MGLWIRSQDKMTLAKPDRIFCEYDGSISCDTVNFASHTIAEYSNEEKAMKVLDMIQKEIIDSNFSYNGVTCSTKPMVRVFQMPSDDEVE